MSDMKPVIAPAPYRVGGYLKPLREDMLGMYEDMMKHGDYVQARILAFWIYYLGDPALVQEFLVKKHKSFHKDLVVKRSTRSFTQDNIFNSDGEFWKKQRKLMQPAFHSQRIGAYADDMVALTKAELDTWQQDDVIDVDQVMAEITMRIIVKTMFNTGIDEDIDELGQAIQDLFAIAGAGVTSLLQLPLWVPTPRNQKVKLYSEKLTDMYQRIMNEWREHGEDRGDLLSMLMLSEYDDGTKMSDAQIMSELGTIFGAGHETTAKTLTFAWYMLSENPDIAAKLHEEVDQVLGGRLATLADLKQLTYTEQIIKETMRLFPAAIAVSRVAIEDVEIGGHTVKKGQSVGVSFWTLHRDERWYPEPLKFDPERWSPENEAKIPRYAYVPFGAGPRVCLGNQFAMMEAQLVLATIAQHYTLTLREGVKIEPEYRFALHPGVDTVPMIAKLRETAPTPA